MLKSILLTIAVAVVIILFLRKRKLSVDAEPGIKELDAKAVSVEIHKQQSNLNNHRK